MKRIAVTGSQGTIGARLCEELARDHDVVRIDLQGGDVTADVRDIERLKKAFAGCDAVLAPAAPGEAPAGLGSTGDPIFNRMWTLLGVPCVTVPARWGENGLPTGVQLVGGPQDDARLMTAAAFLERVLAATV